MSKYETYRKLGGTKIGIWSVLVALVTFYSMAILGIILATKFESRFEEPKKAVECERTHSAHTIKQ